MACVAARDGFRASVPLGMRPGGRTLDLGCGPGGNFALLAPLAPSLSVGFDLAPVALELAYAAAPQARLVRGDLSHPLPFANGAFDLVTIFNVLYHSWIEDESRVLTEACRVLKPGGLLMLTEPAFPCLKRRMDHIGMAKRRYRLSEMRAMVRHAGFQTLQDSYFTSFGFPLALALALTGGSDAETGAADMKPLNPRTNRLFLGLARAEAALIRRGIGMPFGVTLMMIARK